MDPHVDDPIAQESPGVPGEIADGARWCRVGIGGRVRGILRAPDLDRRTEFGNDVCGSSLRRWATPDAIHQAAGG